MIAPKFTVTLGFDFQVAVSDRQLAEALLRAVATPAFGIPGVMTIGNVVPIGDAAIMQGRKGQTQ